MKLYIQVLDEQTKDFFGFHEASDAISLTVTNYDEGTVNVDVMESFFKQFTNLKHFGTNVCDHGEHVQILFEVINKETTVNKIVFKHS